MWNHNDLIKAEWIQGEITQETVQFAERFGTDLAKPEDKVEPLTTNQLRKFFGEVKRQQLVGYNSTNFVMLKPKLAYAVGRAKSAGKKDRKFKIEDFYFVIADAINKVEQAPDKQKAFKNFITIFEAIVAYHKASEK